MRKDKWYETRMTTSCLNGAEDGWVVCTKRRKWKLSLSFIGKIQLMFVALGQPIFIFFTKENIFLLLFTKSSWQALGEWKELSGWINIISDHLGG